MKQLKNLWKDKRGSAVVEATILFPIIFMIFAGLVLLSMYLPTRMVLQQATQYAATAMATEQSDTWLDFDERSMEYEWASNRLQLPNVYVALVQSFFKGNGEAQAETIVRKIEEIGRKEFALPGDMGYNVFNMDNYVFSSLHALY